MGEMRSPHAILFIQGWHHGGLTTLVAVPSGRQESGDGAQQGPLF